jgi:hypothetical protein
MATRKQKRERLTERYQQRLQESIESGLKAQEADRKHREKRLRDSQREKHDKSHSWKKIDHDCILCQDMLKEERMQQSQLMVEGAIRG